MQGFCAQLKEKEREALSANDKEIAKLKEEIQDIRGSRAKMRSIASSVSSGITIYPPGNPTGTPISSPEDNEVMGECDEHRQRMDGDLDGQEQLLGEKRDDQPESHKEEDDDKEETQLKLQSEQGTDSVES